MGARQWRLDGDFSGSSTNPTGNVTREVRGYRGPAGEEYGGNERLRTGGSAKVPAKGDSDKYSNANGLFKGFGAGGFLYSSGGFTNGQYKDSGHYLSRGYEDQDYLDEMDGTQV